MSIIISVSSEKGGVGKSTTAVNVSGGLAKLGKKVLLIDLDQQGNASQYLGYIKDGKPTVSELIYNTIAGIDTDYEATIRHNNNGVDYIPASQMLTGITTFMANDSDSNYYIFDDGEIEPNGDKYNIIRMSTYHNAPRVISPFYEFCKISKHHLNDYHLRASNSLGAGSSVGYGPHAATDISLMWENVWTSHYVLYALHNYQVDVDHQKNCSNNGREFENIFKCKCLDNMPYLPI